MVYSFRGLVVFFCFCFFADGDGILELLGMPCRTDENCDKVFVSILYQQQVQLLVDLSLLPLPLH